MTTSTSITERDGYIFGVDPGDSAGVALFHGVRLLDVFQGPADAALAWLRSRLVIARDLDHNVITACERFVNVGGGRGRKTSQPTAQRLIGAVEYVTGELDVELCLQAPADAKRLASNALLRRLDLYVLPSRVNQPDANDANDAVRHALLVMARRRASTFQRLLESSSLRRP